MNNQHHRLQSHGRRRMMPGPIATLLGNHGLCRPGAVTGRVFQPAVKRAPLLSISRPSLRNQGPTFYPKSKKSIRPDNPFLFQRILGVRLFTGTAEEAVEISLQGGLVVLPTAPDLVELQTNADYREAIFNADLAITDSGLMVLAWWLLTGRQLTRVSGLKYLKLLFEIKALQPRESVLWIMPNAAARDQNLAWLKSQGYDFTESDCYLAPHYPSGNIHDETLIHLVNERRPRHIVVCLGGGTQERLGLMLKRQSDCHPCIHCIGAAIGFLTGNQVHIPTWADRFFLGWLFRCLSEPGKFVPRYWKAFQLLPLMIRYREKAPAVKYS